MRTIDGCIKKDPYNKEAQLVRARVLLDKRNFAESLVSLNAAIVIDPDFGEARFERARVYAILNRFQDSHNDLSYQINRGSGGFFVHAGRSLSNLALGKYEEAIKDAETAARVDSSPSVKYLPHVILSQVFATASDETIRNGDLALAHATIAYDLSVQERHDLPEIFTSLALAYADLEKYQEATSWQQKAIDIAPEAFQSHYREYITSFKSQKPVHTSGKTLAVTIRFWDWHE